MYLLIYYYYIIINSQYYVKDKIFQRYEITKHHVCK